MFTIVQTADRMAEGIKRLTIDLPEELHEKFSRQCFLSKPKRTMKQRIIEFIAKEVGAKVPPSVDRRKLTKEQRENLR